MEKYLLLIKHHDETVDVFHVTVKMTLETAFEREAEYRSNYVKSFKLKELDMNIQNDLESNDYIRLPVVSLV